jgi:Pyruvate/2-oxoacid:ferredoxin oxidoreductase delta subunit
MPRPSKPVYRPPEEQLRLFPPVSANAINGLGERERRPPTPVYWHYGADIPHKELQAYYLRQFDAKPELKDFDKKYGGRGAKAAPAKPAAPVADTPENWSRKIKACALASEGDLVGIARIRPEWIFEGYAVDLPWVMVIGVAMDHAKLAAAPDIASPIEVMTQYNRGTRAARAVANFIQSQGYNARPHGGPMAGPLLLIPPAIDCGMGELGKHGSLINRTYGSSFRLAGVMTDLPLVADNPDSLHVDDFCINCQVCTAACPPDAIFSEKQWVRGELKWYVDFDKCIPYFNDTQGCGICIAVCPWSRPGTAPRLAEKLARRRTRLDGDPRED